MDVELRVPRNWKSIHTVANRADTVKDRFFFHEVLDIFILPNTGSEVYSLLQHEDQDNWHGQALRCRRGLDGCIKEIIMHTSDEDSSEESRVL